MKKLSTFIFFVCLLGGVVLAQSPTDALRFSQTDPLGSARMLGVGNAFTALGADLGVLSLNPAGLAMFRSTEFVFSPGFVTTNTRAALEGDDNLASNQSYRKLKVGSTGLVFYHEPRSSSPWKSMNMAIAYNRTASYGSSVFYSGISEGSIAQHWTEDAQASQTFDPFSTNLAWETSAIYDNNQDGVYENDFQSVPGAKVKRAQNINTSGGQSDIQFAIAGNYEHRFMVGATIGVPILGFNETKEYTESDDNDEVPYFNNLKFTELLSTSGVGINAKLGFIFRVSQALRFGLSAHTPTQFSLEDAFSSQLEHSYTDANNFPPFTESSPSGSFKYQLTTPWRFSSGLAFLMGSHGFVSADVEWVDYSSAKFDFSNGGIEDIEYEQEVNSRISNDFKGGVRARLGAEYAYDVFRVRGGLGMNSSAYRDDDNYYPTFSFGLGLREKRFYLDVSYRFDQQKDTFSPFSRVDATLQPQIDERIRSGYALVTFGFK